MDYARSDSPTSKASPHPDTAAGDNTPDSLPTSVKILIAGGFGVGKTTLVGSVSEVMPLRTEEYLTNEGLGIDDLSGVDLKNTTTVAMDFGRITISGDLIIYLFGTPGQDRFWFVWDELRLGSLGAVVLADTRRLENCFPTVDFFERRGTPFIVAVNCFDGANRRYRPDEVQLALNLDPDVPVLLCDARSRQSAKEVLIALVEHVVKLRHLN
jgi:hypothetical protein